MKTRQSLQAHTLGLDLEITMGGALVHIGAVLGQKTFHWKGRPADAGKALADLDAFGRDAYFILGHNLLNHDLPFLKSAFPNLGLLDRPVIDTLFLSTYMPYKKQLIAPYFVCYYVQN